MIKRVDMIKPFEFILKINENIICQRYFNVKRYNEQCRESLEIKEMMDEIMGLNGFSKLGIIPEFFKFECMANSYKPYFSQNNHYNDKIDVFKFEVWRNNSHEIRNGEELDIALLQREMIASSFFDGKIFHPNVRYDINIRPIIPDITRIITKHLSFRKYTKTYGDISLKRHNKLSVKDLQKIVQ
jgi:hypothetical protein